MLIINTRDSEKIDEIETQKQQQQQKKINK